MKPATADADVHLAMCRQATTAPGARAGVRRARGWAVARAAARDLERRRVVEGGSTITQQYVKNT
jgi:hypothetical protein